MSADNMDVHMNDTTIAKTEAPSKRGKRATASKASAKKQARAPKVTKAKKEPVLITVASQKKFGRNTVLNFCNNYFRTVDDDCRFKFVQSRPTASKVVQPTISLEHIPEIKRLRDVFEHMSPAEAKTVSTLIYTPVIHTVLDFFSKTKTVDAEAFSTLCDALEIKNVNTDGAIVNIINKLVEYMNDTKKITSRAYNYVFGAKYREMFPAKNDVHKRYVQKTPMFIKEILEAKEADYDATPAKIVRMFKDKFDIERKAMDEIVKYVCSNEDNVYQSSNVSKLAKTLGVNKEEAQTRLDAYSELKAIYNYTEYVDKIGDANFFETEMKKVRAIIDEFETCALNVEKACALAKKAKKDIDAWRCLIRCLVYMTRVHARFVQDTKKKTFAYLVNQLGKNKIYINIKNVQFRDNVDKLAIGNKKDAEIDDYAKSSFEFASQLSIPKTYHPRNMDIYNKIGYFIFYNWSCDKPIPKVSKTVRIAVGLAVVKYIENQFAVIKSTKSNGKIVIQF